MRTMKSTAAMAAILACGAAAAGAEEPGRGANLALVAKPSTSFVSGHETLEAINNGYTPRHSDDKSRGAYGNWARTGTQWVQYDWDRPVRTGAIDVYWFDDHRGVRLPSACRLLYWDGNGFTPVRGASGFGLKEHAFNTTAFEPVTTTRLRLEFDGNGDASTGILQWRVYDAGGSPNFPPAVDAGVDRTVLPGMETFLAGSVRDDGKVEAAVKVAWSAVSGPGPVAFDDPGALETAARFSVLGAYTLRLSADDGELTAADTVRVTVAPPFPAGRMDPVYPPRYAIDSRFWNPRIKNLIIHWIPHCMAKISDPDLKEGGIRNFEEAANKLAGRPFKPQQGAVFANGWVFNILEGMCAALMVDPRDDADILRAQASIRATIEDWIPKILSAQEPDGYLQTAYTLSGRERWTHKADHEGYLAGYFIEAALAHYEVTGRKDARLYAAARRLADCWCANIGPAPKKTWYDGHQELEMALVRLARFVEDAEGAGAGRKYLELAKFLLDSRGGGDEYDQSHAPVTRQYEAVGHAVRAVYQYAGMADIAMETGDPAYQGAVRSIWDNIVNRKYYVTGGVGSGETAEGFGKDFSLPNHAYCESCSGCGEIFFQHRMNLACREARYADLYEETLYNAVLGGVDLEAKNYTYTNPLDSGHARYPWHVCPCCVGNIPKTLFMLPTWMYARGDRALYVNLFIGSAVRVGAVAGTEVEVIQDTEYPWSGAVAITVNPAENRRFALKIRAPDRQTSALYTSAPEVRGLTGLAVNGQPVTPAMEHGYAVLDRTWKAGDRVTFEAPMAVQRVKADPRIAAARGRVALRRGPIVYNIESVDQDVDAVLPPAAALSDEWADGLLGGVMVIRGRFADGSPMTAVPNYARNNRGGRAVVWIRDE